MTRVVLLDSVMGLGSVSLVGLELARLEDRLTDRQTIDNVDITVNVTQHVCRPTR